MTVVTRLSKKRKAEITSQIDNARLALDSGDQGSCLAALDKAMKLFNGWDDSGRGTMRYDELNDACDAFLEKSGLPTLAVALSYIEVWRTTEPLARLGRAALDATCDMTHYWRCEAWNTEDGKRRSSDPHPSDDRCTCGLKEIVAAINTAEQSD